MKKLILCALVALLCASCADAKLSPTEKEIKKHVTDFVNDRVGSCEELIINYAMLEAMTALDIELEEKTKYNALAKSPTPELFMGYIARAIYRKDKDSYKVEHINLVYWEDHDPCVFMADPEFRYIYMSDKIQWTTIPVKVNKVR